MLYRLMTALPFFAIAHVGDAKAQQRDLPAEIRELSRACTVGGSVTSKGKIEANIDALITGVVESEGELDIEGTQQKFFDSFGDDSNAKLEAQRIWGSCVINALKIAYGYRKDSENIEYYGENSSLNFEIDFSSYRVGRRAKEFGRDVIVKKSNKGKKYFAPRKSQASFVWSGLPQFSNLRYQIELFWLGRNESRKIEVIFTDGSVRVVEINGTYARIARFDDEEYRLDNIWKGGGSDYNSLVFDFFEGDLTFIINDRVIGVAVVGEGLSISEIHLQDLSLSDGVMGLEYEPS